MESQHSPAQRLVVFFVVSGKRRRLLVLLLFSLTHVRVWICSQFYPSSFPSLVYFLCTSCWDSEGQLAMSGQWDLDLEITG